MEGIVNSLIESLNDEGNNPTELLQDVQIGIETLLEIANPEEQKLLLPVLEFINSKISEVIHRATPILMKEDKPELYDRLFGMTSVLD